MSVYLHGAKSVFDAIDSGVTPITPLTDKADVPIQTKVVKRFFDLDILSFDVQTWMLKNSTIQIKVYLANGFTGIKLPNIDGSNDGKIVNFVDQHTITVQDFIYNKAEKDVVVYFEYCRDDQNAIGDWDTCYNTGNDLDIPYQKRSNARNHFAIRPDKFVVGLSHSDAPNLLRAGQEYNLTIHAPDYNGDDTLDYNQSEDNITISPIRYLANGAPDDGTLVGGTNWTTTGFTMVDGISLHNGDNDVAGIKYSDIGNITIELKDKRWAEVDNDDTFMDCNDSHPHTYICGELNATFIPHHFRVDNIHLRNHNDGNFTYLSNDLNMSAHVDVNISAMNAKDAITHNFKQGSLYYEHNMTVDLNVTEWDTTITPSTRHTLGNLVYKHDIPTETLLGFGGSDANGTHLIPWNESNTTQQLMFNYTREYNQPVNPFMIDGTDINITVKSRYTDSITPSIPAIITGTGISDRNATFYFARAKSSKFFYDDVTDTSINTPISVVVYSEPASSFGLDILLFKPTNEYDWYLSTKHTPSDGNLTLNTDSKTTLDISSQITKSYSDLFNGIFKDSNSSSADATVFDGGSTARPYTSDINLTGTDRWLIYNPNSNSEPNPFYHVKFIGTSTLDWAGHGETGNVVESDASKKKNRRLGW